MSICSGVEVGWTVVPDEAWCKISPMRFEAVEWSWCWDISGIDCSCCGSWVCAWTARDQLLNIAMTANCIMFLNQYFMYAYLGRDSSARERKYDYEQRRAGGCNG